MTPVGRALWFIESHFAGDISLDEIANAGGVSRYHMSRAFAVATGCSGRRCSGGARMGRPSAAP